MAKKTDIDVIIDGKKYTLSGEEDGEYIQKIVSHINKKISEFKEKDWYNHLDKNTKNVLLAINLSDDYHKLAEELSGLKADVKDKEEEFFNIKHELVTLKEELEAAKKENKELKFTGEQAERKVIRLQTELEQAKKSDAANKEAVSDIDKKVKEVKKAQEELSSKMEKTKNELTQKQNELEKEFEKEISNVEPDGQMSFVQQDKDGTDKKKEESKIVNIEDKKNLASSRKKRRS